MPRVAKPMSERLAALVRPGEGGCLVFIGAKRNGYGKLCVRTGGRKTSVMAHRVAYELVKGPIAPGLQIDHLCRNRACCNPDHLEPVTPRENTMRGDAITARNARLTHCKRGHPFDEANTYVDSKGHRNCRQCNSMHAVASIKRKVAAGIAAYVETNGQDAAA